LKDFVKNAYVFSITYENATPEIVRMDPTTSIGCRMLYQLHAEEKWDSFCLNVKYHIPPSVA
jgi:hypothetical protein